MNPGKLIKWSIASGFAGIIFYIVAAVMLLQGGDVLLLGSVDHKDLFFGGSGLLLIAIWFKLGAIYHKGSGSTGT